MLKNTTPIEYQILWEKIIVADDCLRVKDISKSCYIEVLGILLRNREIQ